MTQFFNEDEICAEIKRVALELLDEFDLSAETAKYLSRGVSGFKPHQLLSYRDNPKVGISQKVGEAKFERYISYRIKDRVFSLAAYIGGDDSDNRIRFQVLAPLEFLPNPLSLSVLRKKLMDDEVTNYVNYGSEYSSFKEAEMLFRAIIRIVAPEKKAGLI